MPKAKSKAKKRKGKKRKNPFLERFVTANGRPPKYKSAEEVFEAARDYFQACDAQLPPAMPNKAGLCLWLGISRDTYSEYRKKFPDTIKKIDDAIEDAWVQRLRSNAPTGAIFYLKNAFKNDFKDRHVTDITSGGKALPTPILAHVSVHDGDKKGIATP